MLNRHTIPELKERLAQSTAELEAARAKGADASIIAMMEDEQKRLMEQAGVGQGSAPAETADEPQAAEEEGEDTFTASELELLGNSRGPFFSVVSRLVALVQEEPTSNSDNDLYGRFQLEDYALSVREYRGAFAMARRALDFLEADYLSCEKASVGFWREQVEEADSIRLGIEMPESVPEEEAPEPTHREDGRPTKAYFQACVDAIGWVSEFADREVNGTSRELVGGGHDFDVLQVRRAFEFAPEALEQLTAAFDELVEEEAAETRATLERLVGPIPPASATKEVL